MVKNTDSVKKVKKQIKEIAQHFDLKYNPKWMNYLLIPKEANILMEYYGTCADPDYKKFGINPKTRLKNINEFINSKYFKEHMKRWGGQVCDKKDLAKDLIAFKRIEDDKLKRILLKIINKIKDRIKISKSVILLTKPRSKKELDWTMHFILRHELTHILFQKNRIHFQNKGSKYWKYDEGLATYCDFLIDRKLNKLDKEASNPRCKNLMEKWYYIYAIKFREKLKNKKTSKERKEVISKIYKKLK